jgi:hypothetical protein
MSLIARLCFPIDLRQLNEQGLDAAALDLGKLVLARFNMWYPETMKTHYPNLNVGEIWGNNRSAKHTIDHEVRPAPGYSLYVNVI